MKIINNIEHQLSKAQQTSDLKSARELVEYCKAQAPQQLLAAQEVLGSVFLQLGQATSAVEVFESIVVKTGKKDVTALNNFGVALANANFVERSKSVLRLALELRPDYAEANFNLGNLLVSEKLNIEALKHYAVALDVQPDHLNARVNHAAVNLKLGNYNEAVAQIELALKFDNNNTLALLIIGEALEKLDRRQEAEVRLKKAIDGAPDMLECQISYLSILIKNRKIVEARRLSEKLALGSHSDHVILYNCGLLELVSGNIKAAVKNFQSSISLKSDYLPGLRALEEIKVQLSLAWKADKWLNEAPCDKDRDVDPYLRCLDLINKFVTGAPISEAEIDTQFKELGTTKFHLTVSQLTFCTTYINFISKLRTLRKGNKDYSASAIYWIGESHCLSLANHSIIIDNTKLQIEPRIIFGAKMFHLASKRKNSYLGLLNMHAQSIPHGSRVILSFGEIDTRIDDGFQKYGNNLTWESEIKRYAKAFLVMCDKLAKKYNLIIYILSVPAPVYHTSYNYQKNKNRSDLVRLLNLAIKKECADRNFIFLNVYDCTLNSSGFSNRQYHIDNYHLSPIMKSKIENQLNNAKRDK